MIQGPGQIVIISGEMLNALACMQHWDLTVSFKRPDSFDHQGTLQTLYWIFSELSKASDSDLTSNLIQFVRQIVFMKPWLGAKKIWMWNMSYSIKKNRMRNKT